MPDDGTARGAAGTPWPLARFAGPTLGVARALLGACLVHEEAGGSRLVGRMVETEAYTQDDPAFRSWGVFDAAAGLVKPTGRALDLFGPPGAAYLYRLYGRSWLLNIVTEREGVAGCVLVRAVMPLAGHAMMWARRPAARRDADLTNGPGKLCEAFGLDGRVRGACLTAPPLFIAEGEAVADAAVATSARIGLRFGTDRPYRFFVRGHPFVSPGVPSDEAARRRRQKGRSGGARE